MHVLQVESDLNAAGAVERLIKAAGSSCDTAPTGRLALELAMFEQYDLILLAFALPDMSGADMPPGWTPPASALPSSSGCASGRWPRLTPTSSSGSSAGTSRRGRVAKAPEEKATRNRDSVRHKVLKKGQIVYRNSCCVMDCTILNISATGACIQPADAFDESGTFILKIAHGPTRRCEVRWRSGGKLGVRFIQ